MNDDEIESKIQRVEILKNEFQKNEEPRRIDAEVARRKLKILKIGSATLAWFSLLASFFLANPIYSNTATTIGFSFYIFYLSLDYLNMLAVSAYTSTFTGYATITKKTESKDDI